MSQILAKLLASAQRRQLILDCINARPGAVMGEIVDYLAAHDDTGNSGCAANTIRTMTDWGEIRHEGKSRSRRYYPIVRTTRSAEECKERREIQLAEANAARHNVAAADTGKNRPGYYRHKPQEHPHPRQGGQGALRRTVYVNCQQNY